jgi:hypothetical protein
MRIIITATAVVALSLLVQGLGLTQAGAQTSYNRCVELASRQGLKAKSASGRKFINRCMQRGTTKQRGTPSGSSPNCPDDDPFSRSAYPSWMCR